MTTRLDDALGRLAAHHHGVFAMQHLRLLQWTDDARHARIAAGRWDVIHDGVYRIAGAPKTWEGDLLAACLAAGPEALASHASAAALWGLPSGRTGAVEITCPRWQRARHQGLVVHESSALDELDRSTRHGIPCTTPERTLFDLARRLSPVMLDANVDTALRRGLVTVGDLTSTAARLATKGRPGGRRFRAAVEKRADGAAIPESVPERVLADMLVRQGLPAPTHQHVIRDEAGGFVARVDLAWPDSKLVVEYDSVEHHLGTAAHFRDSARRNAICDLGYTVLTATAADLEDRATRLAASVRRQLNTAS
jgi:very-short-patch-repair endonuclease